MSTRGQVMLIIDGYYYGFYQHYDMYPSHHPKRLFEEAAEISENDEWDDIALGFLTKTWVCEMEDYELSKGLLQTVATAETPTLMCNKPGNLITDDPDVVSFKKAASMPVMCREKLWSESDTEYALVVDLDANKIVCIDTSQREVLLAADLNDPEAIRQEASRADGVGSHGMLRSLPLNRWRSDVKQLGDMTDQTAPFTTGQWNRPYGFPKFKGTPSHYPANAYRREAQERVETELICKPLPHKVSHTTSQSCTHVGKRTKRPCIRNKHTDPHHRY